MKKNICLALAFSMLLLSCNKNDETNDATGVFEATEVIVSAEASGKLLSFQLREGDQVSTETNLGLIDTTHLYFSKQQLIANKKVLQASLPNVATQIEATKLEIMKQTYEKERIEKLLAGDVATQKQMDDIEAAIKVLHARLNSQKSTLSKSVNSIYAQINALEVQEEQVNDQLEKCKIYSSIDGIVLVKYAEEGEMTAIGKPLFKVADLNTIFLKAYLTAGQLSQVKLGQPVKVFGEFGESDTKAYDGKITWISSKSEFTPKTIQTQDERANLVYAIKVAVKNDGFLKIGMYGGLKIAE